MMQEEEIISMILSKEEQNKTSTPSSDKITLIIQSHSPFSPEIISIPQILFELYAEIFDFNVEYTNSYTLDNSKIVSSLPYAIYGRNIIKKYNLPYFLKKLTRSEKLNIPFTIHSEALNTKIQEIEKLILTDLQLLLSVYNYKKYYNSSASYSCFLKQIFGLIYNTRDSLRTFRNDKRILKEVFEVYHINKEDQILNIVKEINKKVESLLEELNGVGNSYCKDISTIQMNHLYILISAMYKAQTKVFNLDQENSLLNLCPMIRITELNQEIEELLILYKTGKKKRTNFDLISSNDEITHKINYGENHGFKEYTSITAHTEKFKSEFVRKIFFLGGFFGLIVYLRLKRG